MTKLVKYQVGFSLLWVVSSLIGWRALVEIFTLSWLNDEYTHVILILPISAALIFVEWASIKAMASLNLRVGPALLSLAVMISCYALGGATSFTADELLSIRMFALVLWWIGSFVLCFGYRASQSVMFPLCFLFGLVPFPQVVLNAIVNILQYSSSWAAYVLFATFGVPVARDGIFLTIPGLTLEVAQECSSIRSSSMLLVMTMVLAQILLRSPWKKALVIIVAVPLSIAKNGLRIFSIGMLGTRVDPGYLTGRFHHQGGIIFFLIALVVIFALLWILRRGEGSFSMPDLNREANQG